ncbi:MAG: gas vesicle protein [Pseudomonadota bacterium]
MTHHHQGSHIQGDSLADVLERVLDKGIVIAGDISVAVAGVELLSLKVRLVITTVDKALEMGIDWWKHDPMMCSNAHHPELRKSDNQGMTYRKNEPNSTDPKIAADGQRRSERII